MARSRNEWSKVPRTTGIYINKEGQLLARASARCPKTGRVLDKEEVLPAGASIEDALALRQELKQRLGTTQPPTPRASRLTVADYAKLWITRQSRVRKKTFDTYERSVAHLVTGLGEIWIDALTRGDYEAWVSRIERMRQPSGQYYALETVRGWDRVARKLLRDAVADLGLSRDPTDRVDPPRQQLHHVPRRERRTLSAPQLGALLQALRECAPHRFAEIATAAVTGLRASELYGLTWAQLELDVPGQEVLRVTQSVTLKEVNLPKTTDPREVPLPPFLVEALSEHRAFLEAKEHPGLKLDLVFPSRRGSYRDAGSTRKLLARAAKLAGIELRVSPQVLRRTWVTLMVVNGVDRLVQRSMVGHTTEAMTARYTGIAMEHKRPAVEGLAQLIALEPAAAETVLEGEEEDVLGPSVGTRS